MSQTPQAAVKRCSLLSPFWIVPILALALAGFFAFQHLTREGPKITIRFSDADGIVAGKTLIKLRGVKVGEVGSVDWDEQRGEVVVTAHLLRSVAGLAREGTTFVLSKPQLGFMGIQGLSTIFSGPALELRPGSGAPARDFRGYPDERSLLSEEPSLRLRLSAGGIRALAEGDPVVYRGIEVGAVSRTSLAPDGGSVSVELAIEERYAPLVRVTSKFWEASGVQVRFGLGGLRVDVESLQSLLKGGIAFATPKPGPAARPGAAFFLYSKPEPSWEK